MSVLAKINIIVKLVRVGEHLKVSENVVASWKKWSWPKDSLPENGMGSKEAKYNQQVFSSIFRNPKCRK